MPARDLSDLALTGTLLEAAKFQAIRRKNRPEAQGILFSASDLRAYRRAAPPERLLVLVIDFTSLAGWDWGAAVLPFLKTAYTQRAAVCVVQVGAADAEHELSARRVLGRNVLSAAVNLALASERGKATPLAHGLELALETLRHALRHGRGTALQAQLVVVTDGRGNVPLEASRLRAITAPVSDEGVKDALAVAEKLRALDRVESVLIHPSPRFYPELPSTLAAALGAGMRALKKETG
jgi:magnesium chelatase subunit D